MQPFEDLAHRNSPPNLNEYRIAIAKVNAGDGKWRTRVREFATFAQDVVFQEECSDISHVPERFRRSIQELLRASNSCENSDALHRNFMARLKDVKLTFLELVNKVPFDWEPILFEANTPFTSYLRIRESMAIVKKRFHYFDRYLKSDFFHLFLSSLDTEVAVRLVTTSGNSNYGVKNVIQISELARQEFNDYQLIEAQPKELHDRNLRVDDQIFTLGPGVDRAGMALTNFGPSDSSEKAHKQLDNIIAKGIVVHKS